MNKKEYSVLMSVYEKEKSVNLMQSIESVLHQTIIPREIIIVCDGPLNDDLDRVIDYYVEKYIDIFMVVRLKENKGLGIALNEGLKKCRCDIVARMDSDDICIPDRMERELFAMEQYKADVVSGTILEFEESTDNVISKRVVPELHNDIVRFSRRRNPFNHPAVMFRKSIVIESGGYREFTYFEDYYLWLRIIRYGGKGYNVQEPVLYMRAGFAMYERRGGYKYMKQTLLFRWFMLREKYCGFDDFIIAGIGHAWVTMLPVKTRKFIYGRALRK